MHRPFRVDITFADSYRTVSNSIRDYAWRYIAFETDWKLGAFRGVTLALNDIDAHGLSHVRVSRKHAGIQNVADSVTRIQTLFAAVGGVPETPL